MKKLGFLGCGQMGKAILSGLLREATVKPEQVLVAAKSSAEQTASTFGVRALSPVDLLLEADEIFLGIKPYQLHLIEDWMKDLRVQKKLSESKPVVMSMLAGSSFAQLQQVFTDTVTLVRIMPNLPAQVGSGLTLICIDPQLETAHANLLKERCQQLLKPLGHIETLRKESEFHAATAISGCGPAYLFNVIEALADAGVHEGLPRAMSLRLAAHTVLGSGHLASLEHPAILKDRVTSPAGVTIAGVRVLEQHRVRSAFFEAVIAASERSKAMENK
ncbi:MAG: pyrroline-5-carboxylate reductase [Myxococcales bacterium]|nr:pyrroline-5-carboxylate reductase [Myxococcales bacterium]